MFDAGGLGPAFQVAVEGARGIRRDSQGGWLIEDLNGDKRGWYASVAMNPISVCEPMIRGTCRMPDVSEHGCGPGPPRPRAASGVPESRRLRRRPPQGVVNPRAILHAGMCLQPALRGVQLSSLGRRCASRPANLGDQAFSRVEFEPFGQIRCVPPIERLAAQACCVRQYFESAICRCEYWVAQEVTRLANQSRAGRRLRHRVCAVRLRAARPTAALDEGVAGTRRKNADARSSGGLSVCTSSIHRKRSA